MPAYVEVSINLARISGTYHYHLPAELVGKVQTGCLVVVPFGAQTVQGIVLDLIDTPEVRETLPVDSLVDEEPVLTLKQTTLARWMAETEMAPLGACVGLMIPPGLSQKADVLVQAGAENPSLESLPEVQKRLLLMLQKRGPLRGRQLDAAFKHVNWRGSLAALKRQGWVHTRGVLPPARISPKTIRTAQLAVLPEKINDPDLPLGRVLEVIERRHKVLQLLASEPLPVDFSWIYAQTNAIYPDLKKLVEEGLILFNETEIWRDPLEKIVMPPSTAPILTGDQQKAWDLIQTDLQQLRVGKPAKPILLHGVTGSGKTEVYMRALAHVLEAGRQALVLVPEISLTPQIVRRFLALFPNQVGIYHSRLSEGERYDTWRRARSGDLKVIIGARSALFMPMQDLGLIVIDECDHDSYDQDDLMPYYHGVTAALTYARLSGALLLMGSATPRVTQYYKTQRGEWKLITLPQRILAFRDMAESMPAEPADLSPYRDLPPVQVVDMRGELKAGNRSALSRDLQNALKNTFAKGEQSILFLNRKGSATYVFCRECGYVLTCPHDDRSLIYHSSRNALVCHECGYTRKMPKKCPNCGGNQIRQLGMGTEKLEEIIRELLPQARILRWDADTTSQKGAHDLILSHFSTHRADILIGTQMLAKGLDLPLVTLVGVILAEVGLKLPDYRAPERTFQLLTQVAGRAGRSPKGGSAILQTYMPENYAIQTASKHDFNDFYLQELNWRRKLGYPPFKKLVRLEYRHQDPQRCERVCREMASNLLTWINESNMRSTDLIGPVPCFYSRLGGLYRWQIIVRGPNPEKLIQGKSLRDWIVAVNPSSLL